MSQMFQYELRSVSPDKLYIVDTLLMAIFTLRAGKILLYAFLLLLGTSTVYCASARVL